MPTVNVYSTDDTFSIPENVMNDFKALIAKELTCGEIALSPDEISIRLLTVSGDMIGSVEVEIKAHAFGERIPRQDEICRLVRTFLMERLPKVGDIRVWLVLSELGHSW